MQERYQDFKTLGGLMLIITQIKIKIYYIFNPKSTSCLFPEHFSQIHQLSIIIMFLI